MKKLLWGLSSLIIVGTTSLTTISCGVQKPGWYNQQSYWGVLDYQGFSDWMTNVDLISQAEWNNIEPEQKEQTWSTLTNVELNNFMSMMNLTYQYLNAQPEKPEKFAIDDLGGLYSNFGYAVLENEASFANRLTKLKYNDELLIENWEPLTWENFNHDFKATNLPNNFLFGGEPIEMTITANDGSSAVDSRIKQAWDPIAKAIVEQDSNNSESTIQQLWNDLKGHHFEAFIFNLNIYWPIEDEDGSAPRTSFEINLTFDF